MSAVIFLLCSAFIYATSTSRTVAGFFIPNGNAEYPKSEACKSYEEKKSKFSRIGITQAARQTIAVLAESKDSVSGEAVIYLLHKDGHSLKNIKSYMSFFIEYRQSRAGQQQVLDCVREESRIRKANLAAKFAIKSSNAYRYAPEPLPTWNDVLVGNWDYLSRKWDYLSRK